MARKRKSANDKMAWARTLLLAGVFIVVIWCMIRAAHTIGSATQPPASSAIGQVDLLHPVTNPALSQTMLEYEGFTINFNPDLHIPNWVSWELLGSETEGNHEWDKFMPDSDIEGSAYPKDYSGSGYDRGHMAPRADMKWSREAVRQCYYMTNMCPQVHSLNAGAWKKLETKCRDWAQIDSAIVIICGPVLSNPPDEFIGTSQVAVPKAFFKVIAAPYASPPRAIGFIMNNGRVDGGIQTAAVSVDSIESITGHDFFAALPDSIENPMESQCRFHYWSSRKVKK